MGKQAVARILLVAFLFAQGATASTACLDTVASVLSSHLQTRGIILPNRDLVPGNILSVPTDPTLARRAFADGAAGPVGAVHLNSNFGQRLYGGVFHFDRDTDWQVLAAGADGPHVFDYGGTPREFANLLGETFRFAVDRADAPALRVVALRAPDGTQGFGKVDPATGELVIGAFYDPSNSQVIHWILPQPGELSTLGPDRRAPLDHGGIVVTTAGGAHGPGRVLRVAPLSREFVRETRPAVARYAWDRETLREERAAAVASLRARTEDLASAAATAAAEAELAFPASSRERPWPRPYGFPWIDLAATPTFGVALASLGTGWLMHGGWLKPSDLRPWDLPILSAMASPLYALFSLPFSQTPVERALDAFFHWKDTRRLAREAAARQNEARRLQAIAVRNLRAEIESLEKIIATADARLAALDQDRAADFTLGTGQTPTFAPYAPSTPPLAPLWNELAPAWTGGEAYHYTVAFRRAERLYLTTREEQEFVALVRRLDAENADTQTMRVAFDAFLGPRERAQFAAPMTLRDLASSRPQR